METITDIFVYLTSLIRPYNAQITIGFVGTLLVIYGDDVLRPIKKMIKKYHFIPRVMILVAVAAFGFSLLTNVGNEFLARQLLKIPEQWYFVVVLSSFFVIGFIAEKRKYI